MTSLSPAAPQLTNALALAKDLLRSVTELGPLPSTRNLQADLRTLAAYCEARGVDADVVVTSSLDAAGAAAVASWLSPSMNAAALLEAGAGSAGELSLDFADGSGVTRIVGQGRAPVQKVTAPRPAVLIAIASADDKLSPADHDAVSEAMEDRAMIVLVNPTSIGSAPELQTLAREAQPALMDSVAASSLTANGWHARLESGSAQNISAILRALAALYGVESATKVIRIVIEQEQRSLKVKRALAQQESAKLQHPAANPMELVAETRTRMQRSFSDFERSVQEALRSLFLPQVGTLTQSAEQFLLKLGPFEEQKGEKTITLRLGDRVESEFFRRVREACREHCVRDLARLDALFEKSVAEGNAALAVAGAPQVTMSHATIPELRLSRMLDSALRIDRPYRGELPNHGIQEYIQQVKKYVNIWAGIVSVAGVSTAKFLPAKTILGITVGLTALGLATLPQRIKRERAENLARELERARDVMRGEARRIFGEVEREWLAAVGEALRDEQTLYLSLFEAAVREGQTQRTSELAEDRRRLQRQMSAMDNSDRLLTAAKRTRDAVEASVTQLRNTLRQQLTAINAASRRPA